MTELEIELQEMYDALKEQHDKQFAARLVCTPEPLHEELKKRKAMCDAVNLQTFNGITRQNIIEFSERIAELSPKKIDNPTVDDVMDALKANYSQNAKEIEELECAIQQRRDHLKNTWMIPR